jgi:hypothetical protein
MRSRSRLDAVTGVVGDAAGALRRRRENRRPYAKVYDADGRAQLLDPAGDQARDLLDTAGAMVDAAAPDPSDGRPEGA